LILIIYLVFLHGVNIVIYGKMDDPKLNLYREVTHDHLEKFGVDGLWTLCLAYRELDVPLYEAWNDKFIHAKSTLQNMENKLDEVNNFSQ
jgi:phospholipid-transporting ATPase